MKKKNNHVTLPYTNGQTDLIGGGGIRVADGRHAYAGVIACVTHKDYTHRNIRLCERRRLGGRAIEVQRVSRKKLERSRRLRCDGCSAGSVAAAAAAAMDRRRSVQRRVVQHQRVQYR